MWKQPGGEHRARVPGGDDRVGARRRRPRGTRRRASCPASRARPRRASRPSRSVSAASTSSSPLRVEARLVRTAPARLVRGRLERARDDLRPGPGRRPSRRPRRERAWSRATERGVRSGSTSRPRYVLQVGHTRCGRFGWWQFGHSFTRGAFEAMRRPPLVAARRSSVFASGLPWRPSRFRRRPTARAMGEPDLRGGWPDGDRWPKTACGFRLYRGFAFA